MVSSRVHPCRTSPAASDSQLDDTATIMREDDRVDHDGEGHRRASTKQTVVNMAKTCMGTGSLALPFAAKQGGILIHIFGLLLIGYWNVITVQLLCQCYDMVHYRSRDSSKNNTLLSIEETTPLTESDSDVESPTENSHHSYQSVQNNEFSSNNKQEPPKGTTTLVKLAWHALGPMGANALDIIMAVYLIGVVVTYLNAMKSFLSDSGFSTGVSVLDSLMLVVILGPLSSVPHMGHLAHASAMGLLVLLATFFVITWDGYVGLPISLATKDDNAWQFETKDSWISQVETDDATSSSVWFPENGLAGISQWFGCVVFGFGIAPLTFNFRETMKEPSSIISATEWAVLLVAGSYIVLGLALWYPFPSIEGDVLHELPTNGWLPAATRLSMVLMVLVTAPLLIIPCAELLEGKFVTTDHVPQPSDESLLWQEPKTTKPLTARRVKMLIRWSICLLCAAISTFVPAFVNLLSFVGCCCVAVVGFCVPPLLHARLSWKAEMWTARSLAIDLSLLTWGLVATIVSTTYTFHEIGS